jgi:hypothetical protein
MRDVELHREYSIRVQWLSLSEGSDTLLKLSFAERTNRVAAFL